MGAWACERVDARRAGAQLRGWARLRKCEDSCPVAYLGEWMVGKVVAWLRGSVGCVGAFEAPRARILLCKCARVACGDGCLARWGRELSHAGWMAHR